MLWLRVMVRVKGRVRVRVRVRVMVKVRVGVMVTDLNRTLIPISIISCPPRRVVVI